ncbi:GH1 family beta-glucosidase [Gynuella sp.]|uniref:GH1 family beta-glucosidase n=1 Tax=Gynuella sp. TaxID=2969146 RepID=UPI003D0F528B
MTPTKFSITAGVPLLNALPKDFIWGAATSALQIEGATGLDGRGRSIWDTFSKRRGKIRAGDHPEQACEHYHRYSQDIRLMRRLNLQAYRLSIAWPRIFPRGRGRINHAGLDYYKRLTDELLNAGIRPFVTLFHWDMPQALYDSHRGFLHRDMAAIFADYVETVVRGLGDRVKDWITLNEPFEHAALGHLTGDHAPGRRSLSGYFTVMHHQLLGHGLALQRIRALAPDARVGITLSQTPIHPASGRQRDQWAAGFANQLINRITLDPLLKGKYPEQVQRRMRWFWPKVTAADLNCIHQPLDFLGINHYSCEFASYRWYIPFLRCWINGAAVAEQEAEIDGRRYTAMGWEVKPEGMAEVLRMLRQEYANPEVIITENGAAFEDQLIDGRVSDPKRIDYLRSYIAEVNRARADGSNVTGYFVWSLMDNFEWAAGYQKRFGLIHVDYPSQRRTIKDSGYWYARLIAEHK